jgi:hypothetical protein
VTFGGRTVRGQVEWAQPESHNGTGMWPAPDLALIRVLEPVEHRCVWLTERTSRVFTTEQVAYFGCVEEGGLVTDFSGRCTIRGELGEGLLRLGNEDEMPEGASGGPLVDLARGEVIGVVKAKRAGRDGGLAISTVQLRRIALPDRPVAGERDDLYQRVVHAHDRYHRQQHRDSRPDLQTWTDAQSRLKGAAQRALSPGERAELLGVLAELPPPVSTVSLDEMLRSLTGQSYEGLPLAPRGWRDALGLLYDLPGGNGELETILRYCVHAATADRPYTASAAVEARLWEWAEDAAAAAMLSRLFRRTLGSEKGARLRARGITRVFPRPDRTDLEEESVSGSAAPLSVLLEVLPDGWDRDRHHWRVCVVQPSGELDPVEEEFAGTTLPGLPERLHAPLTEAFRRCDEPGRRAPLQVAVPHTLLGLPVDEWRLPGARRPLGAVRPVVVRCADCTDHDSVRRHKRWRTVQAGPMAPAVLDCDEGLPEPLPDLADLNGRDLYTVPVLCRTGDADADPGALRRVIDAGYNIALFGREARGRGAVCAEFHRGVLRTVSDAVRADRLPGVLHRLRADVDNGVPEAYWSKGIVLLYEDPSRPLPGVDHPLDVP